MPGDAGYSLANVPSGSFWYCRINGNEIGPMATGRLKQMARQQKLLPDDQVKLGAAGDWTEAAEVAGLFRGVKSTTRKKTNVAKPQSYSSDAASSSASLSLGDAWDAVRFWLVETMDRLRESWALVRVVCSWVFLVVVTVTLVVLVGRNFISFWPSSGSDAYAALDLAWIELKQLRETEASPDRWSEFVANTDTQIAPIVADLEQRAGATDRCSQQLLWAARDCWPQMLADARQEVSESERRFEQHLANARTLKSGQSLYPRAQRIGGSASFDFKMFTREYGDWLVAGLILLDALLIILLARWWWKQRT